MITFPVCHSDTPWCCPLCLFEDNGRLACLIIRLPGFFLSPSSYPSSFLDTDTAQHISSNYCRNKESALPQTTICSTPEGRRVVEGCFEMSHSLKREGRMWPEYYTGSNKISNDCKYESSIQCM